jgi:hypothetical protein
MANRIAIDINVAVEEMLGLGIEGASKYLFDENLLEAGGCERGEQDAHHER